ncbi:MAG: thioredoxin domain-containing protein [Longimicrobiales bacterium]|nr:thioredoxin domain-containing protein [Longimicrobiales bacterium]
MPNRLTRETSPYLRQHAHNPVEWYPWGAEALERAREEDRPILLSIGYAACHWCHVMERESFDDPAVAGVMNARFVNIKVDREERPDLDTIYMKAVQAVTGQGGWPLTAFLTPDGRPFHGGTYFPPEPRHGMPSFGQLLDAIHDAWTQRREEVERGADELTGAVRRMMGSAPSPRPDPPTPGETGPSLARETTGEVDDLARTLLPEAFRTLADQFDPEDGGFGGAPKFPQPVLLAFLLGRHAGSGEEEALRIVVHTLRAMARGGIRDHLGGGFHRYSTDAHWVVPHFEKMLHDNALLARVYLRASIQASDPALSRVAEDILDDLLRTFRTDTGGFVSAHDADSEGEEGAFYLWSPGEIDAAAVEAGIPAETAERFRTAYGVTSRGTLAGRSILHLSESLASHAARAGTTEDELRSSFEPLVSTLRRMRDRREPPRVDDKVLVGWNAFTIRTFAEAGVRLGRPDLTATARRTARLILDEGRADGHLRRVVGGTRVPAFLEDFAALGNALLTLHEATLEPAWLTEVRWCVDELLRRFVDPEGRLWDAADDAEALILRPRDVADTATPSGTSLAIELLLRAGHLLDEPEWTEGARTWLTEESGRARRIPAAFGHLLSQVERSVADPVEIVIVGRAGPERDALLRAAWTGAHPARVIAGHDPDDADARAHLPDIPLFAHRHPLDGTPTAWVCRGYSCDAPTTDPDAVRAALAYP